MDINSCLKEKFGVKSQISIGGAVGVGGGVGGGGREKRERICWEPDKV